ncbi:imelysin family protein [Chthonobacter albigriseus]|uniref:imelysin family protein n=1 Tax=Chthonobacter albigriseus TaxID=1683161 RepID=UPI0015EF4B93|nr:imelysin family protein [Chthonobacter albigriseus]
MPLFASTGPRLAKRLADLAVASALTLAALLAGTGRAPAQEAETQREQPVTEDQYAAVVRAIVEKHIRPAAERLSQDAELLSADVQALCANPTEDSLATTRRSFESTVRALAAMDGIRIGPLVQDNRLEKLAFWPDPRGIGLKQVQAVLVKADATAADPATLAGKSVGVQGLTALEFVLYGTGAEALLQPADPAGAFRCRYGAAIAANVAGLSSTLVEGWEGEGADLLLQPGPRNPQFRTHAEAAGALFSAMATGLEVLADQKLRTPLGDSAEKARPKLSYFWRSSQTFPSIAATLEAIQHEFEVSGASDLLEKPQLWLANSIVFEAGNAARKAQGITLPPAEAFNDPAVREQAKYLSIVASSLKRSIGRETAVALGLEQSFNALDGD